MPFELESSILLILLEVNAKAKQELKATYAHNTPNTQKLFSLTLGQRLTEATKINMSLSTLGNVISALVDGNNIEN